jgi:hypothetical protein
VHICTVGIMQLDIIFALLCEANKAGVTLEFSPIPARRNSIGASCAVTATGAFDCTLSEYRETAQKIVRARH